MKCHVFYGSLCRLWPLCAADADTILLGEQAVASPSTGNTSWRVWTVFTRSATTPPEVNRFGWNLGRSEYIVCRWPWQIVGAMAEKRERESEPKLCFLSGKQRAISPTSGRPNFTKFAHNTWICVAMNRFRTKCWRFPRKGFFSKKTTFLEKSWRTSDFRPP